VWEECGVHTPKWMWMGEEGRMSGEGTHDPIKRLSFQLKRGRGT
jgi:hypothetical protein